MSKKTGLAAMLVDCLIAHDHPLFHVTDQSHLPSIAQHGLLSEVERQVRGIFPQFPGGNALSRALDSQYGLLNYVFLGFFRSGVMPAHKHERCRRPRTLHVHPQVLQFPGARIALGRANHARTRSYSVARATQEMDGEVFEKLLMGNNDWGQTPKWKINRVLDYEVLIPAQVPAEYIIDMD